VVFATVLEQSIARVEALVASSAVDRGCPVATVVSIATMSGEVLVLYVADLADALPGVLWHGCRDGEAVVWMYTGELQKALSRECSV
jgi:hypothetical protein